MKKIASIFIMALVAMGFTACSDCDEFVVENVDNTATGGLKLVAGMPGISNDTRTAIGTEDGKTVPMWSLVYDRDLDALAADHVYAIFAGQKRNYRFNITSPLPSKTAVFEEEIPEGEKSIVEALKNVPADTPVYFMKNDRYRRNDDHTQPSIWMGGGALEQGQIPSSDDLLTSKAVSAGDIVDNGAKALNLSFKRFNAFIRINLIPEEGLDFNDFEVVTVKLSTSPDYNGSEEENFGGQYNLDLATVTMTPTSNFATSVSVYDDKFYVGRKQTIKPGKDGFPAYVASRPISLKAGQKIYLILELKGNIELGTIEYTVPEGGIDIKAGTVTTFNLKVTQKDMRTHQIFLKKKGTLTEDMLEGAIAFAVEKGLDVYIEGDVNATDIQTIKNVFGKPVTKETPAVGLNVYRIYIVDDLSTYRNDNGEDVPAYNWTLGRHMFSNMPRLKRLTIPRNVLKIETAAVNNNPNLEILNVGKTWGEVEIKQNAFNLNDRGWAETILKFNLPKDNCKMDNDINIVSAPDGKVDLELNISWMEADGKGGYYLPDNKWMGVTWKTVTPLNS